MLAGEKTRVSSQGQKQWKTMVGAEGERDSPC